MSFAFASIALGTLGALIYKNSTEETTNIGVISNVNGKEYKVIPSGDRQGAADMLATLEHKARDFMKRAASMFPSDHHISRLASNWTGRLSEIPQSDTIAYALEKKDIFICVRDSRGVIQDVNDLFFVLLHELSHIQNDTYGHGEDFWKNFKRTLEIANKLGCLPYKNYDKYSVTVCGKTISSNPMSCVQNGECFSELRPLRPKK